MAGLDPATHQKTRIGGADFDLIEISKTDGGYFARATPPHVAAEWQTARPMEASVIIAELRARGAHQSDIGDAFNAADPSWLENSN